jgi:hypothetical protein
VLVKEEKKIQAQKVKKAKLAAKAKMLTQENK